MGSSDSPGVVFGVLGAIAIGVISALTMTAITATSIFFELDGKILDLYPDSGGGDKALYWLAAIGIASAVLFTFGDDARARAWTVTLSLLCAFPIAIRIFYVMGSQSGDGGVMVSFGPGLFIPIIAFLVAIGIVWFAARSESATVSKSSVYHESARPPTMEISPAYGAPGTIFQIRMQGFDSSAPIDLTWFGVDGQQSKLGQAWSTINRTAQFEFRILPNTLPGESRVTATQSVSLYTNLTTEAKFLIMAAPATVDGISSSDLALDSDQAASAVRPSEV